jgi:hypothetical protein
MVWTDLITEPRAVTSLYGGAPALGAFALEEIELAGGIATLVGDLAHLPAPLPPRWQQRGYTRARLKLSALNLAHATVEGAPRLTFDADNCLMGQPVDLDIATGDGTWRTPDGAAHPYVVVRGTSAFLRFTFVCEALIATVEGYEPAPY